jgi:Ca-activated chloride channel family protein
MRARILSLNVVLFLLAAVVATQTAGRLTGTARDSTGGVLPGVRIEVKGPLPGDQIRTTLTNDKGAFTLDGLPPGRYRVTFSLEGFTTVIEENVDVTTGATRQLDASLKIGNVTEVVIVAANAPAIVDVMSARQVVRGGGMDEVRKPGRSRARYAHVEENPFRRVSSAPLSTFSIDVDTASYANVRRFLNDGGLPPRDAVRIEEMINYFRFDYPSPPSGVPFSVTTEMSQSPWHPGYRVALIGLRGRETFQAEQAARNLVFLLDVSGSMEDEDKLPLVKQAMRMLTDTLQPRDRVAIVVYAGNSGVVLPSTSGDRKDLIHAAIDRLEAGGSTNGGEGIRRAYELARQQYVKGGVNRVILATDGDFNVGVTSYGRLLDLIERERRSGVFLTVLGVGTDNLQDETMEMLADKGNGNYAYLDSVQEAHRVLVREASSTLVTIARDVKLQVEFNPATVAAYRLVGYENRLLNTEDFNDDEKDAGEIGAGHTVTALYEIIPAGAEVPGPAPEPLKYQAPAPRASRTARGTTATELFTVKVRYKEPEERRSRLVSVAVQDAPAPMSPSLSFASAVAEFGMLLRDSAYRGDASYERVTERARRFRGSNIAGEYHAEFIRLVETASRLTP